MKVGILTFHASCNYGGLLQCWALQTALRKMGYETRAIDRWITPGNWHLERNFASKPLRWRFRFRLRAFLGLGENLFLARIRRCKRFIRRRLHPTPYHFHYWNDAPRDMGLDAIVVGSDIIWHCGSFGDPKPYLLYGAPPLPAVAYAASFGMDELPRFLSDEKDAEESAPVYRFGLARFSAIGCRDAEGVQICGSLGFRAHQVVDPVLLVGREEWKREFRLPRPPRRGPGRLLCYLLKENVTEARRLLDVFAQENGCRVDVFVHDTPRTEDYLPIPTSPAKALKWFRGMRRRFGRVRIRESAGPIQFLRTLAAARWIVTDSFHGLMFAAVFGKDVRTLAPSTESRRRLFQRIEEFSAHFSRSVVMPDLPSALSSLADVRPVRIDESWLADRKRESHSFLANALEEVARSR